MKRRKRIKRWLAAWRRLIAFGKMLQELHEQGFTLITWAAHGSQVRVQAVDGLVQPVNISLDGKKLATVTPIASAKSAYAEEGPPSPPPPGPPDPPKPPDHRPVAGSAASLSRAVTYAMSAIKSRK